MDFNLEQSKAHAIKNLNYSNNLHEKLELMAEELDEKYDEIEELKQEIEKLKQENQKLKQQKKDKVNRDLDQIARWIRKSNEDYDDWSYNDEKEKLEVYIGNHTERYTRQELVECGVLYD